MPMAGLGAVVARRQGRPSAFFGREAVCFRVVILPYLWRN